MFDDNLTAIILASLAFLTTLATLFFQFMTNIKLNSVAKAVDGITTLRVQSEKDLGEAKSEIARGEGRDAERQRSELKAANVAEGVKRAASVYSPRASDDVDPPQKVVPVPADGVLEVKVVEAAPVKIEASIPLEIKK